MNSVARFTLISSKTELCKRIDLGDDGSFKKTPSAEMYEGSYVVRECSPEAFARLLETLYGRSHQAIALGITRCPSGFIRTQKFLKDRPDVAKDVIARTKEHFGFPDGPGLLLFDFDNTDKTPEELLSAMSMFEGFSECPKIVEYSSSSAVRKKEEPVGSGKFGGLHVWLFLRDAKDIERLRTALLERLWLAGLGTIAISKCGSLLERALLDMAVLSPERLVFVASPILGAGLAQDRPPVQLLNPDGPFWDTSSVRDLTEVEKGQYLTMVQNAKREKEPEAAEIRQAYVESKGKEMSQRLGIPVERAKRQLENSLKDGGLLYGAFPLADGDFTVADVLLSPEKYDGYDIPDPHDEGGRIRARIYSNKATGGTPTIHSFDGGGKMYRLVRPELVVRVGQCARVLSELEGALGCLTEPYVFRRDNELVTISRDEHGIKLRPFDAVAARTTFSKLVEAVKIDSDGNKRRVEIPESVLKAFVQKGEWNA